MIKSHRKALGESLSVVEDCRFWCFEFRGAGLKAERSPAIDRSSVSDAPSVCVVYVRRKEC